MIEVWLVEDLGEEKFYFLKLKIQEDMIQLKIQKGKLAICVEK